MSVIEHKTLRSRATDQEALAERARKLVAGPANGIKLVFVSVVSSEATLEVDFYNRNFLQAIVDKFDAESPTDSSIARRIFPISGGHRLHAGAAAGQVHVTKIAKSADFDAPDSTQPTTLVLTVTPIGDYSTYKLSVDTTVFPTGDVVIDPVFNEIDFKFRPGCFNVNCAPDWEPGERPLDEPPIDYLAKDYDSFRHTMIAAMMQRVPEWQTSSEADLDQVLLDLFSAAADELSDYQDRVMSEAYLASARKRVSLARHARLMDYHIHQGNQASAILALEVALSQPSEPQVGATKQYFFDNHVKVWAGTPDEDSRSVPFLSNGTTRVHQLVNRMSLYTWSDSIPSLLAGDTSADLKLFLDDTTPAPDQASALVVEKLIRSGVITHLLIQEHLNPATGSVNGFNPNKRQLLRLLPGNAGAEAMFDPVSAQWFVRVRWDERDKLRSNYCFTIDCGPGTGKVNNVSLFHGNLVEVTHGELKTAIFKDPNVLLTSPLESHYERAGKWSPRSAKLGRWGTICALPDHPLAYRLTEPGGEVPPLSTLNVIVKQPGAGGDPWDEVPSFIHSDDSDENGDHFVVETDEEGFSIIRFGNGKNGKELPENSEVHCTYQVGRGQDGNIGLDTLINFDPATSAFLKLEANILGPTTDGTIIRCWNPFDITNGRAPEPATEIIRRVPEAYRARQLRAITLQDYINRAEEIPGVSNAAARYAWTGSWRTVQVTIDPVGTTVLSDEMRKQVASYLNAVRLIGEDLEIRPPQFVPLEIHVAVCAKDDFWPEDLKAILEQEFSDGWTPDGRMGFFHPDLWTFGQQLKASQIIGRVLAVEGIEHVIKVKMKRFAHTGQFLTQITNVNYDEILQVRNDPDHMELGSIDFEVQGGRR
jgi:baseplate J-like protein